MGTPASGSRAAAERALGRKAVLRAVPGGSHPVQSGLPLAEVLVLAIRHAALSHLGCSRRDQGTPAVIPYEWPGLIGLELWHGIARGATLYQLRDSKPEY